MDLTARRNERRKQVKRCLASDMTIKQWCNLNKVSESTIYKWQATFRKEEPELFANPTTSKWIEVSRSAIKAATALAVVDPSKSSTPGRNASIDIKHHNQPATIRTIINGVERSIPPGSKELDIAAVMKAVMSL